MSEHFTTVPGWPKYLVSQNGEVLGQKGQPLKPFIDDRGRRSVTLSKDRQTKKFFLSQLVLLAFVGPCPTGMEACHNDGNHTNNNLGNLRWDTHSSNLLDRRRHGTSVCGEKHPRSKLSNEQVIEIRRRRANGEPLTPIARDMGVSNQMVSYIARGKNWVHLLEKERGDDN